MHTGFLDGVGFYAAWPCGVPVHGVCGSAPRAQVSKGNSAERLRTNGQIVRVMSAFEGMRATQLQIVFDALDVDGCGILQKPDVARCARLGSSQRAEAAP